MRRSWKRNWCQGEGRHVAAETTNCLCRPPQQLLLPLCCSCAHTECCQYSTPNTHNALEVFTLCIRQKALQVEGSRRPGDGSHLPKPTASLWETSNQPPNRSSRRSERLRAARNSKRPVQQIQLTAARGVCCSHLLHLVGGCFSCCCCCLLLQAGQREEHYRQLHGGWCSFSACCTYCC